MRELEPPIDRDTTERDATTGMCAAERFVEGDATSAINAVGPEEWDSDSEMDPSKGVVESSCTPVPVSRTPGSAAGTPRTSRDGLPDYVALITAEIEAIEARRTAAARISEAVSQETPQPSGTDPSRKRYPRASSLGVGELLLTARELTGLTQSQLAARASTSQSAISSMETGNRLPSVRTLMRIAEAAGFELVVGLRAPGGNDPMVLGALIADPEDDLADFVSIRTPSVLDHLPADD
jgi:transcriptional regulator with XRE-family HTH domain